MTMWDHLPPEAVTALADHQHRDYECIRCLAFMTGATRQDLTGDGWATYRIPGPDSAMASRATSVPQDAGIDVYLCGDCAAMMRTLQSIRIVRGVGEVTP